MRPIVPLYFLLMIFCACITLNKIYSQGCPTPVFAPVSSFAPLNSSFSLTLGDFNNDGYIDMITANVDQTISVALGNGTGKYVTGSKPSIGFSAHYITNGDFNGDGKLDLVTTNFPSNIAVLPGNGDGSFGSPVFYSTPGFSRAVVTGDFNGDGKLDIVSANQEDGTVSVFLGTGNGSFIPA